MKKSSKKTTSKKKTSKKHSIDLFTEIVGISMIGLAMLIMASLFTQQVGLIGEGIETLLVGLLGIGGYILPLYMIFAGVLYMKGDFDHLFDSLKYMIPLICIVITFCHLLSYGSDVEWSLLSLNYIKGATYYTGGWVGALFAYSLLKLLGIWGSYIVLFVLFAIWILIATNFPIFSWIHEKITYLIREGACAFKANYENRKLNKVTNKTHKLEQNTKKAQQASQYVASEEEKFEHPPIIINHNEAELYEAEEREIHSEVRHEMPPVQQYQPPQRGSNKHEKTEPLNIPSMDRGDDVDYQFPSIDLLAKPELTTSQKGSSRNSLANAKKLEDTLMSFGVEAKVTQINKGPTVTRYELQPKQGVKVSKIVNLADDIALNLAASGIRIEAPIPGKAAVGIEVPNETSEMVYLRDVIDSDQFQAFPSKLAFALGKDIAGKPIITDIAKMPHMLIAGATGSGKSVCINTLITSVLYKAKPSEVKLIMIDPKVVELNVYNGIPHLLIPVVTDPKKAAGALCWAVNEMTKRYNLFAENNVRDMKGYNGKMEDETLRMPNIIIIIDELADLMMTAAREVEDAICRLAQMARAAGIHLVIATQRPSVDVITGVIKANIPSRLAFAVSSGIDSRTILDSNGAEKLLGKGDMLFCPVGESKPIRIQGAFISDKEVESIVELVKQSGEVKYEEAVLESISAPTINIESSEEDELIGQAIQLAKGKEKLSISMLQRYFRIGFNRASRLMDALESRGVVGADEGSKPRKVLNTTMDEGEEL